MVEYIEREAFLERVDGIWDCADMVFEPNDKCCRSDDCASCKWRETKNAIRKIAAYLPAADVRPVRHGRWVKVHDEVCYWLACSVCGEEIPKRFGTDHYTNFCPNCGADMREES